EVAEGELLEQVAARVAEGGDAGVVERVGEAHSLERAMQRVAGGDGEAGARLRVILQRVQERLGKVQPLAGQDVELLRLVEVVTARVDREPELQRAVEQVRLGEAEKQVALAIADVGLNGERFAEAEEVIGLVVQADKRSGQTADAAR